MGISTDMSKVKESKCFGIAWDGEVAECKMCEVAVACKQRTLGGVKKAPNTKPTTKKSDTTDTASTMKPASARPEPKKDEEPKEDKAAKKTASKPAGKAAKSKKEKTEVKYDPDMPEFKPMSVDELMELAQERGIDPADFDKYTSVPIKKMRVTMALKKTYEI